ncbi:MAG: hypothetical protein AAF488_10640 [Planctomycetota bacterium]
MSNAAVPSTVPSNYLDWLQRADLAETFADPIATAGTIGPIGWGALILVVAGFGIAVVHRRWAPGGLIASLIGCGIGWFSSYMGYRGAVDVIASSGATPTPEEIDRAANLTAFVPILVTAGVTALIVVVALASTGRALFGDRD